VSATEAATRFVERAWYGDDAAAKATRLALRPLAALYGVAVATRGRLYDRELLTVQDTAIPALSVGNLTVGGTGKTPVAAWLAAQLRALGARPAIVLRGYGGDEPLVHGVLNPDVPVVASADRVAGIADAAARGADVAVLADAFQHRRARRVADVVLLSADRWDGSPPLLLPAGPWREPLSALRRASLAIVTRKAASVSRAAEVVAAVRAAAPGLAVAVVHLAPADLRPAPGATPSGDTIPLVSLAGSSTFAVSAIGDARAFHAQLEEAGASLRPPPAVYPDHHAFDDADVARLVRDGALASRVVCTLKDAVKLSPRWPRAAPPLWYVSQRVAPEGGAGAVQDLLHGVLLARAPGATLPTSTPPAPAG